MHIWEDICMQHIHCTLILSPQTYEFEFCAAYYSSNAQNELTLDDRLFGLIVVKTITANLSNFHPQKTSSNSRFKILCKYININFNVIVNWISIHINEEKNFTWYELLKIFMPHYFLPPLNIFFTIYIATQSMKIIFL